MTSFSLRSLLLAAIVLSNCISWTTSRHHYTHNVSGHRSRHRRQGAGLYLSASYVLPGGEGTGWGEWGDVSPCSRTCGGGVASQKRICLQVGVDGKPQCSGGDTKYFSCETQDCPAGSRDFRAQQCSQFDDVLFRDVKYRWVPYTQAPNPCELNCMPHGERFYYRHLPKVVDGTRCNDESFDVCVNGTCQPVGCDMMLGSSAREDKCRECRGRGVNCQTSGGLLDSDDLRKGYNDVLLIPEGATNIAVAERAPSRNYLALHAVNGTYYLNGEYQIDFPRSLTIAGALWYYERSQQGFAAPDKLRCLGPTNEPLILALLLQDDNVGIEYEYSVPSERAPPKNKQYNWAHEEFSSCSAPCGGGYQTRNVSCRSREELELVDEVLCDKELKPPTNQTCNTQPCEAQWTPEPWGECSQRCGEGGTRSRTVHCTQIISNGYSSIVGDKSCFEIHGPKPPLHETCNENATCPIWFTGPWKPCDKLCDEGKQTRKVVCYQKNGSRKEILNDKECEDEKPTTEQSCMLQPCDGVDWVLSEWVGCDSCLSTVRTRTAVCTTKRAVVVNDSFCAYHETPVSEEPCDKTELPACEVQWYATQWSNCSVDCGKGIQTRKVFCGLFDGASVLKVNDSRCSGQEKYNSTKECEVPEDQCPSKFYAGPWGVCNKKCGGGEQYREVMCLRGGKPATDCTEKVLLSDSQPCNTGPCDKDELLSVNTTLSPPDEDYEDCLEGEEFEEVGLDSDLTPSTVDFLTTMLGDSPTEGSGTSETWGSTSPAEHESTFPETSDTFSIDELLSTGTSSTSDFTDFSGSGDDTTATAGDYSDTTDTSDLDTNITTNSGSEGSTAPSNDTAAASSVSGGVTESTEYEDTEETKSTEEESPSSTASGETSDTESTGSAKSSETVSTDASKTSTMSGSESTDLRATTELEDPISLEGTRGLEPTITPETGSTESPETTISEKTESSEKTETDSTELSETTEYGTTKLSGTSELGTTESSELESTKTSETTESSSTASSETTISGSTETSETTESDSTEPSETTETDITEELETTESDKTESLETTETSSTEPSETTESESTESPKMTKTDSTESSETTVSESKETSETTDSGSTEPSKTTETDSIESSETTVSESKETSETTDSGSTELSKTSEPGSTESSVTTESISTESSATTELGSTESSLVTESSSTESSEPTDSGSTESSEKTEASSKETSGTTESGTTEPSVTTETGSSESSETTELGSTEPSVTTESGSTDLSSTNERGTEPSKTTELSSTDSSDTTIFSSTKLSETTEFGSTESSGTTESSSIEPSETTESGSTEPLEIAVSGSTDASETTEYGSTESSETTESGITESSEITESGSTIQTETTETSSEVAATETSTESATTEASTGTTRWDLSSTVEEYSTKKARVCRPRSCNNTQFGCCPDKKTAALGPFDAGCPKPRTCAESIYGCCPDGVSPAKGPLHRGCPVEPCAETLFGCCESDNITAAEGNEQEGCPPPPPTCMASKYGCCNDETEAKGPEKEGCPETSTTVTSATSEEFTESTEAFESTTKGSMGTEGTTGTEGSTKSEGSTGVKGPTTSEGSTNAESCNESEFGCCFDNETPASGPELQGCPCDASQFGCCPDGVSSAQGPESEGCVKSCNTSAFGCCSDGESPAHGPDQVGCCLNTRFGCCPDNYKPAEGPHLEGCGCQYSRFGCCPDNVTLASGSNNKGCGCQYAEHGCCPDRHTEASGPEFEGCMCHTYQFGCCPDGVTIAQGPNGQGCYCQYSKFGCCSDDQTHAKGPGRQGCDCSTSKYGCCLDGVTEATGPKFEGCTDKPLDRQAACHLKFERGPCRNYSVGWFYDTEYGGCSRFWYGGCEGNGNRFNSKEECEDTCVSPPAKEVCRLPQVKGACNGYHQRWYYDTEREMCSNFIYGGCLGNANNFESRDLCQAQCEPDTTLDQCSLTIERGSCAGNYLRWGYNSNTKSCEQFIWGGCEGNSNRFSSEAGCMLRCNPPGKPQPECSLAQEKGNGTDVEAQWSFSQTENRCVPFYYSGYGGNGNKYTTREECQLACPSAYEPELCTLPAATGDCYDYREKWYFDTKTQRCGMFYYGGCGGNENRFNSEQECVYRCSPPAPTPADPAPLPAPSSTRAPDAEAYCFMEIDAGPCNHNVTTRWGYDYTRGKCVSFQFGGCGGNQNNFLTEEICAHYCRPAQDICQLPMLAGPCDASVMRWFYDAASDSCSQFTYGGCDGNDNRFENREECESRCKSAPAATVSTTTPTAAQVIPSVCAVSPVLELCRPEAAAEVWYYNEVSAECTAHQNLESGVVCRNTGVFYSQEACERACGVFRNIDVCQYGKEPGPCHDFRSKYFYNRNTSRCEEFAYGGCFGGANRFSTEQECEQVCMTSVDPCTLSPEPGNCVDHNVMWYYRADADRCDQFVFGGCGGNDNKFESRDACEARCRGQPATTTLAPTQPTRQLEPEECRRPDSLEACGSNETVFYWDEVTGRCQGAAIGGCRSSARLYRSEEECERTCGAFRGVDVCRAVLDPGPCRGAFPKFYFEAASGSCRPFTYGGCQGGSNRFSTSEECQRVCAGAGPEPPSACDSYKEECAAIRETCAFEVKVYGSADGCSRCECAEPAGCDALLRECEALRCRYGVQQDALPDGCVKCKCVEDPCARNPCAPTERCLVLGSRDSVTLQVTYSPQCETNEIVSDCKEYEAECSRLRCQYGIQRTRVGRCERCACVRQETNCTLLRLECERVACHYGLVRTLDEDGCERCVCLKPPCETKVCPAGERCVSAPFRDPATHEKRYAANCKSVSKPGACPAGDEPVSRSTEAQCAHECADDADCRGRLKCCARGCSQLCLPPAPPTTPRPSTTHQPDVPRAPEPYPDAEHNQPQVEAAEGGRATLRCYFHGNPPPKITWRFGEVTIEGDAGRYRLLSDGALEIISLFRNDSGVYICVAQNDLGTAEQQVTLTVADPVETPAAVAGGEGRITGDLGRALTVRCPVYGYPTPSIFWYRDNEMVPFSNALYEARGLDLLIRRLSVDTLGRYECQAYNGVGRPATWRVLVQAFRPAGETRRVPYLVEREVAVTPRARTAVPATTSTTTTEKPFFTIPPYIVPVRTSLPASSAGAAGSQISLPCDVEGYPEPEVRWTKDDAPVVSSDRIWIAGTRLTIERAEVSDSGVYACVATNIYNSDSSAVRVTVQELSIPASCIDNPTFANCALIVQSKFCYHKYYSTFCCKSCVEAGQLDPRDALMQADQSYRK